MVWIAVGAALETVLLLLVMGACRSAGVDYGDQPDEASPPDSHTKTSA